MCKRLHNPSQKDQPVYIFTFFSIFDIFFRQHELRDPALRDDLAAARAILKKHHAMLLTASKAYVRHPELAAAKANRDFVMRQVPLINLLQGTLKIWTKE